MLILDTGPLRELLAFVAVKTLRFKGLRTELKHLDGEQQYRRCSDFIGRFERRTTTAGVVIELGHWIRRTDKGGHFQLWEQVYDEFRRMGMDEHAAALLKMPISEVAKHGPADASLIHCAQQNAADKPVVFTIDTALWSVCQRARVKAVTLQEIVVGESD